MASSPTRKFQSEIGINYFAFQRMAFPSIFYFFKVHGMGMQGDQLKNLLISGVMEPYSNAKEMKKQILF